MKAAPSGLPCPLTQARQRFDFFQMKVLSGGLFTSYRIHTLPKPVNLGCHGQEPQAPSYIAARFIFSFKD
jgi:hypothetical protein